MKTCSIISVAVLMVLTNLVGANEADDTTITITGHTAGATPFISNLTLEVSNTTVLNSIRFAIDPKPGSVTRPLSGTYANYYLVERGFEQPPPATTVTVPVYGLYAGYTNIVRLTYRFMDGSSKQAVTSITSATFDDTCGYDNPTIVQARKKSRDLSYDYLMVKGNCSYFEPAIIDTDGALRWVGTAGLSAGNVILFDNAVYLGHGPLLTRIELDGAFSQIGDYSSLGIVAFHHNIDRGKVGIILDATTTTSVASTLMEVGVSGTVLKQWDMAAIISAAMRAGGDDPSRFVYPPPTDWFHINGSAYNRADDSLIVSSRENFLICLDYKTSAIKWILGDTTKKWYQFPSLRKFALMLAPGSLPPIGQHAPSITYDQNLLVFDNGRESVFQYPRGEHRNYASPRKYTLDLVGHVATEVWNYPANQNVHCPLCSSIYEDAPYNYLIDYAIVNQGLPGGIPVFAQLLGLNAAGETIFSYRYPAPNCGTIYRALPVHLENTKFPAVGPEALNLSTRGTVSRGDDVLINGFIIAGNGPKTVILRALGPSLAGVGVSGALPDPGLSLYNSSGSLIATNDNWQTDLGSAYMAQNGFAPTNPAESATLQTLMPGAYTAVVRGRNGSEGVSLAEIYDLSPVSGSKLKNMIPVGPSAPGITCLLVASSLETWGAQPWLCASLVHRWVLSV